MVSVSLKLLLRPKSSCTNFGPWKTFRPRLPKRMYGVAPPGYAGLAKREFGVPTPYVVLQKSIAACGTPWATAPGKPQPILLMSVNIPSAGLFPLYAEVRLEPTKCGWDLR